MRNIVIICFVVLLVAPALAQARESVFNDQRQKTRSFPSVEVDYGVLPGVRQRALERARQEKEAAKKAEEERARKEQAARQALQDTIDEQATQIDDQATQIEALHQQVKKLEEQQKQQEEKQVSDSKANAQYE